jgi:DnaK suppressor protein
VSDPLTPARIAELRADLERLDGDLSGQLQRLGEDSRPVTLDQQSVGRLSRMDAIQQQQMAVANAGHIRAHLQRVRRAIAAIESGDFGHCRDCGGEIGFERLKVRPDSPLCIACQGQIES